MANPQEFTLCESTTAGASFTTSIAVLNFQLGSIHVIYSGVDTETGVLNVRGSNDPRVKTAPASAAWSSLNSDAVTMLTSCTNRLFSVGDVSYSWMQLEYQANSNTTGSLSIYATMKSYA